MYQAALPPSAGGGQPPERGTMGAYLSKEANFAVVGCGEGKL